MSKEKISNLKGLVSERKNLRKEIMNKKGNLKFIEANIKSVIMSLSEKEKKKFKNRYNIIINNKEIEIEKIDTDFNLFILKNKVKDYYNKKSLEFNSYINYNFKLKDKYKIEVGDYVKLNENILNEEFETYNKRIIEHYKNGNKPLKVIKVLFYDKSNEYRVKGFNKILKEKEVNKVEKTKDITLNIDGKEIDIKDKTIGEITNLIFGADK